MIPAVVHRIDLHCTENALDPTEPTHDLLGFVLVNHFVHLETAPVGTLEHVLIRFDWLHFHVRQLHPIERR